MQPLLPPRPLTLLPSPACYAARGCRKLATVPRTAGSGSQPQPPPSAKPESRLSCGRRTTGPTISHGIYGAPKLTHALRQHGIRVAQRTVSNHFRQLGLQAHWGGGWLPRRNSPTGSTTSAQCRGLPPRYPNPIQQHFTPPPPTRSRYQILPICQHSRPSPTLAPTE